MQKLCEFCPELHLSYRNRKIKVSLSNWNDRGKEEEESLCYHNSNIVKFLEAWLLWKGNEYCINDLFCERFPTNLFIFFFFLSVRYIFLTFRTWVSKRRRGERACALKRRMPVLNIGDSVNSSWIFCDRKTQPTLWMAKSSTIWRLMYCEFSLYKVFF